VEMSSIASVFKLSILLLAHLAAPSHFRGASIEWDQDRSFDDGTNWRINLRFYMDLRSSFVTSPYPCLPGQSTTVYSYIVEKANPPSSNAFNIPFVCVDMRDGTRATVLRMVGRTTQTLPKTLFQVCELLLFCLALRFADFFIVDV